MGHSHDHSAGLNLKTAFFLNLGFTVLEIVGGLATNSVAVLSDAVHDAGDCLSLGAAWYLQNLSTRVSDSRHTYGYRRYSPLGALVTGTVLLAGMIVILYQAVPRLQDPQPVHAEGMMGLAVLGILVNGFAAYRASHGRSLNESVVSWHLLEDVLGWIAVLLGSIAIRLWELPIIDPLLSIGISLFILWNVVRQLRKVARVFLQQAPEDFDLPGFEKRVQALPNVVDLHHTHVWTLDGEHHVLTTHAVVKADTSRKVLVETKRSIYQFLEDSGFSHLTVEMEWEGEACSLGAETDR